VFLFVYIICLVVLIVIIKKSFKKEKLSLIKKIESEIEELQSELENAVPNSLQYDSIKLHLNIAYLKLSICKNFNNGEIK
jgi:hypothetical protein